MFVKIAFHILRIIHIFRKIICSFRVKERERERERERPDAAVKSVFV